MSTEQPTCKTDLKKNVIDNDVFDHELAMCQNLSKKNDGRCNWGVCKNCGVLPLLLKLNQGILLEKPEEILEAKNKILF